MRESTVKKCLTIIFALPVAILLTLTSCFNAGPRDSIHPGNGTLTVDAGTDNHVYIEESYDPEYIEEPYDTEAWLKSLEFVPCDVSIDEEFEDNRLRLYTYGGDEKEIAEQLSSVHDIVSVKFETDSYRGGVFVVTLKNHSKKRVIEVIKTIEDINWMLQPRPIYIYIPPHDVSPVTDDPNVLYIISDAESLIKTPDIPEKILSDLKYPIDGVTWLGNVDGIYFGIEWTELCWEETSFFHGYGFKTGQSHAFYRYDSNSCVLTIKDHSIPNDEFMTEYEAKTLFEFVRGSVFQSRSYNRAEETDSSNGRFETQ